MCSCNLCTQMQPSTPGSHMQPICPLFAFYIAWALLIASCFLIDLVIACYIYCRHRARNARDEAASNNPIKLSSVVPRASALHSWRRTSVKRSSVTPVTTSFIQRDMRRSQSFSNERVSTVVLRDESPASWEEKTALPTNVSARQLIPRALRLSANAKTSA